MDHLVATCNDAYIVYYYDKQKRRRIRGIKGAGSNGDAFIPLRHTQEFAETLLKVIADCDKYNATQLHLQPEQDGKESQDQESRSNQMTEEEEQASFVNNIAAVLDADDFEVFTALIMKAKQSPDLNSETRSALRSEAEIRKEEREAAFKDAFEIVSRLPVDNNVQNFTRASAFKAQALTLLATAGKETE